MLYSGITAGDIQREANIIGKEAGLMKVNFHIDPQMADEQHTDFYITEITDSIQAAADLLTAERPLHDHHHPEIPTGDTGSPDIVWCTMGTSLVPVNTDDIYAVYTFHDHTCVATKDAQYEYRGRLYQIRELLPGKFIETSRNASLNMDYIQFLDLSFSGTITVFMKNKQKIQVSRRFISEFKRRLGL